MKKRNKKLSGFTLIETMVATGVIVIGLMSSLLVITNSLAAITGFQDRLVAANLVAEGIEVVRNIRDNNWLQNQTWNNGLTDGDYAAAYDSLALTPYLDVPLRLSSSGIYDYSPLSDPTVFKRKITIINFSNYEMRVISTVTWQRKSTFTASAEEHLFNWK